MDTVCYIHYVLQPHIYYVLQKLAPPPENPRSAPGGPLMVLSSRHPEARNSWGSDQSKAGIQVMGYFPGKSVPLLCV